MQYLMRLCADFNIKVPYLSRLASTRFDEDVEFRNINGANVPIKNGKLQGEAGFNILMGKEYTGYKGQAAIDKLLQEKQGHIKAAFYHDDIGDIDIFWGDESAGICHIIEERKRRGDNPQKLLKELPTIIERGIVGENANFPGVRENIIYKGRIVIVAYELRGHESSAILTAFRT